MRISAWASSLVFSAHAEVVPYAPVLEDSQDRILRARGGSSGSAVLVEMGYEYSPRTRR